jgi:hypothetical protein
VQHRRDRTIRLALEKLQILRATTDGEIEAAFAALGSFGRRR